MNGRNSAALLAFLLFSLHAFAANVSISIEPKNKAVEILQLYPDEIGELEIIVANNEIEPVNGLNLKISVAEGLALLKDSAEMSIISEQIALLAPHESKQIFIELKSKGLSRDVQYVYVNYGIEKFTHLTATYVEMLESPLELDARLEKSILDLGEGSKLILNLQNDSNITINNISAELVLTTGMSAKSPKLSVASLNAGERIADKELSFDVEPQVYGKKDVLLLVSFEDSAGRHVLQKNFALEVQNKKLIFYAAIGAIIALIIIAFYIKHRQSKGKKSAEQEKPK